MVNFRTNDVALFGKTRELFSFFYEDLVETSFEILVGKKVTIFPLVEKLCCRPNLVGSEKGDA